MIAPRTDVALADWCTLGVGGPARYFVQARSESDILAALRWAGDRGMAVFVLGGGSNIVIDDRGYDGLVLQIAIVGVEEEREHGRAVFRVGSGEDWDPFVARTVSDNCAGLECLSGIPGLVGGTPVQNVGAYGQDVSGTIRAVRVVDRERGTAREMHATECGFGYRTSRFKHADAGRFIVTGVEFALTPDGAPTVEYADVVKYFARRAGTPSLDEVRCAIIEIRSRKGMVIRDGNPANKSVGSFFVNPVIAGPHYARVAQHVAGENVPHYPVDGDRVKVPAAWLIERAGFTRGYVQGAVGISPFQAQGLINRGGASADDIVALAVAIKRAVRAAFGVALVPEPVFVGFAGRSDVQWLLDPEAA